jgi:hypothetical protein
VEPGLRVYEEEGITGIERAGPGNLNSEDK